MVAPGLDGFSHKAVTTVMTQKQPPGTTNTTSTLTLGVPHISTVLLVNFPSIYYVIFFAPSLRQALSSVVKICNALAAPMCLVAFSLILHYFFINGLYIYYDISDYAFGDPYHSTKNKASQAEGFYQLFVLLTTANHPDILMKLFYENNRLVLVCISYMLITNIVMMNLVLAVVTDTFETVLTEQIALQETIRESMLQTAYQTLSRLDISTGENEGISVQMMLSVLEEIDKYRHFYTATLEATCEWQTSGGRIESTLRDCLKGFGHQGITESDLSLRHLVLDISNFKRGDCLEARTITDEEFRTLAALYLLPFELRDWSSIYNHWIAAQLLDNRGQRHVSEEQSLGMFVTWDTDDAAQNESGLMSTAYQWAASYPEFRHLWTEAYWGYEWVCLHTVSNVMVLASVIYAFTPYSPNDVYTWPIFTTWFSIEVLAGAFANATRFCWYQHFTYGHHWIDIALAIDAIVICFTEDSNQSLWAAARLLRISRLLLNGLKLRHMLSAMKTALMNVAPHLGLWFVSVMAFVISGSPIHTT